MSKVAIVFFSKGGRTRDVAEYVAKALGADTFDLKSNPTIDLSAYDRIIVGSGIRMGKPYKPAVQFAVDNADAFKGKTVYLYFCCLYDDEKGAAQCQKLAKQFGITDATFFPVKGEKNESGVVKDVDAFISRMGV